MRIREIGIRIAMGAGPGSVIALVSRQGLAPAFVGLILGLPLAVILTRYLRQMLFGISADDPAVFTISVAALALISILAAGAAAYRACRVDASTLLR
jgi:ABC-type antimicrobial peptide transport system permease subunit